MGRGEAPWPGAAVRGLRSTPVRGTRGRAGPTGTARCERGRVPPAWLALALTLPSLALAACGNLGADRAGPGAATRSTAPASVSASARPPLAGAELCTSAVGYWARRILDGGTLYGDYQSMGLSNRQYDILREVVAAARPTQREHGDRATEELTVRRVRETCAERYRDGGPSEGPWQR
ncbi:hypothetical protein ACIGO6_05050 [Streptomyces sp. NPDC053750]|uniref:hypothetical protein n=1 Tax=Streptomyces sp. NPDC053750 TaxID=3365714 RepID=UPI0037D87DD1